MKIAVITPMYNEIGHVHNYFTNVLKDNIYDDIVILDDGSTDGTWEVLQTYSRKYNNVHVYRNEKNSIINHGLNRWMVLSELAAKFDPTWINARAADTIYSYGAKDVFRNRLQRAVDEGVHLLCLPWVNVWRSNTWYRCDGVWGNWAHTHAITSLWRFHKNFNWDEAHKIAGMHQGFVRPTSLGFDTNIKLKLEAFNDINKVPWPVVILHYGMRYDELILDRFRKNMEEAEASYKIGRSFGMPPPSMMPPVVQWPVHNGYMAFFEFNAKLKRVLDIWFDAPIDYEESIPKLLDLYDVIKEYNSQRAEEFRHLYNRQGGMYEAKL